MVNIFPYFILMDSQGKIPLSYTLFESGSNGHHDRKYYYKNLFDGMMDVFHVSLPKAGTHNTRAMVAETVWPIASLYHGQDINTNQFIPNLMENLIFRSN